MRDSERNVDAFWESIDTFYEAEAGIAQHETIRQCLIQGGQMQWTPIWVAPETLKTLTKDYEYQRFSKTIHDVSLQLTGNFNSD
jgi:hypothetical protein